MKITWLNDYSENVFSHQGIYEVTEEDGHYVPLDDVEHLFDEDGESWCWQDIEDNGVYELTEEGQEMYEQWCYDAGAGYDLCYGRMKGLADRYTRRQLFDVLISDRSLSTKVED